MKNIMSDNNINNFNNNENNNTNSQDLDPDVAALAMLKSSQTKLIVACLLILLSTFIGSIFFSVPALILVYLSRRNLKKINMSKNEAQIRVLRLYKLSTWVLIFSIAIVALSVAILGYALYMAYLFLNSGLDFTNMSYTEIYASLESFLANGIPGSGDAAGIISGENNARGAWG